MTCPYCSAWLATSDEMIANRIRNMAAAPGATPFPCPQCSGTDWAISRERIEAKEAAPKKKQWWRRSLPSSKTMFGVSLIMSLFAVGMTLRDGPSWAGMAVMFAAGMNLSAAFYFAIHARAEKAFNTLLESYKQMHEMNNDLIAGKLSVHVIAHDDPPIAPKLH